MIPKPGELWRYNASTYSAIYIIHETNVSGEVLHSLVSDSDGAGALYSITLCWRLDNFLALHTKVSVFKNKLKTLLT